MKKTILYYLGLLWAASTLIGCEENTALEYENDPRLYFYNNAYGQRDSIAQTFFVLPDEQLRDTVLLDIRTMGYPENVDRPISLIQTNAGKPDAAIPGKHFVAFDDAEVKNKMVIPAGKVNVQIPIIVLRDPSLKTSVIRFELEIGENQYFKRGIDKWSRFVVTTTASAAKPSNWDKGWEYVFGVWGAEKMWFIVFHVGLSDFSIVPSDMGYRNYLKGRATQKLLEYNLAHPGKPLEEADGTLVTF